VLAAARRALATYKVPKRVIFAPELPKTLSGKIRRREVLAEMVPVQGS
jgi:acyl-coenzyme A synthetase/AMP-(fatty) acid ligase